MIFLLKYIFISIALFFLDTLLLNFVIISCTTYECFEFLFFPKFHLSLFVPQVNLLSFLIIRRVQLNFYRL